MSHYRSMAERALDQRGVHYEVFEYSPDVRSAEGMAAAIGRPADEVYKTLVAFRSDRSRPMLVMIPGDRELAPRRLAAALGAKKVHLATQREAEELTGLEKGGISALALLGRPFDVLLDASARGLDRIVVSAGRKGLSLSVSVADLVCVTGAVFVDAAESVG